MKKPMTTTRLIAIAPALMLMASILTSLVSGNDKAPFLVIGVLALNLPLMIVYGIGIVSGNRAYKPHITVNAAILVYAAAVILAARQGWIDSFLFLGLR